MKRSRENHISPNTFQTDISNYRVASLLKSTLLCINILTSRNIDENQSPDILLRRQQRKRVRDREKERDTQCWTKILRPVDFYV